MAKTTKQFNLKLVNAYKYYWKISDQLTEDNLHWEALASAIKGTARIIQLTQQRLYRTGRYEELKKLYTYVGVVTFMTDYINTEIVGNNKRGYGVSDSATKQALCWKNINNILRQCVLADPANSGSFGKLVEERLGLK